MTLYDEELQEAETEIRQAAHKVNVSGYQGEYIFETLKSSGSFYEEELLNFLAHIDLKGSTILDVGANIGNHTLGFALSHPTSRIVSIEPYAANLRMLKINIDKNGLTDRVNVIEAAAGNADENLQIYRTNPSNLGAVTVRRPDHTAADESSVRQIRLDDIEVYDGVGMVKIDVEGFELAVLQGAADLIRKHRPIIITEAHSPDAYRDIAALLAEYSYLPVSIRGRSDNFVWASPGTVLTETQFRQLLRLSDLMDRRELRGKVVKRLNLIESELRHKE